MYNNLNNHSKLQKINGGIAAYLGGLFLPCSCRNWIQYTVVETVVLQQIIVDLELKFRSAPS